MRKQIFSSFFPVSGGYFDDYRNPIDGGILYYEFKMEFREREKVDLFGYWVLGIIFLLFLEDRLNTSDGSF